MSVSIQDDLLSAAGTREQAEALEAAIALYESDQVTERKAARLAGLPLLEFQTILASRGISSRYDVRELEEDLETMRWLSGLGESSGAAAPVDHLCAWRD